jgi:hypothetical protein
MGRIYKTAVSTSTPRIKATITAIPVAALTKVCMVSPAICVRKVIVVLPAYDCRFVFVTTLIAVLRARSDETAGRDSGDLQEGDPEGVGGRTGQRIRSIESERGGEMPLPLHFLVPVDTGQEVYELVSSPEDRGQQVQVGKIREKLVTSRIMPMVRNYQV